MKEVGGNDLPIRVVVRNEADSARKLLEKSFPGFKELAVTPKSKTLFSIADAIAVAEGTEGVIAYGNYANAITANVSILKIDGKSATDPDYPYQVTLALIFKEKNYTGAIKALVEFATSKAAHEAIKNGGGIPLP
jgi:phosphate transport system substrate-binding protein